MNQAEFKDNYNLLLLFLERTGTKKRGTGVVVEGGVRIRKEFVNQKGRRPICPVKNRKVDTRVFANDIIDF